MSLARRLGAPRVLGIALRSAGLLAEGADVVTKLDQAVDVAASGLTNRDIAQALFVTPKTVESHLGQTYRKLNVASRRQLPCIMSQPNADVGSPRVSQAQ